jgi:hypothetical protein
VDGVLPQAPHTLLPCVSFRNHQYITMLSIPGPCRGQSLSYQDLIHTITSLSVNISQHSSKFVHLAGSQLQPYTVSSQFLEPVGGLLKALLPALRDIYAVEPDPPAGAVEGVSVNYPVYWD